MIDAGMCRQIVALKSELLVVQCTYFACASVDLTVFHVHVHVHLHACASGVSMMRVLSVWLSLSQQKIELDFI